MRQLVASVIRRHMIMVVIMDVRGDTLSQYAIPKLVIQKTHVYTTVYGFRSMMLHPMLLELPGRSRQKPLLGDVSC